MKAIVAFTLAFLAAGSKSDPETVDGLLKRDTNSWKVPIVAKQPNENKPTQVVGGYPQLSPDTLARPLKAKSGPKRPFNQYLAAEPTSSSAIPKHILQWLAQRQSQASTAKPGEDQQVGKPVQRSVVASTLKEIQRPQAALTTPRTKLIQRPSYNPDLAQSTTETATTTTQKDEIMINPKVAALMMDDFIARKKDKLSVAGLVIGLTFVAAFISIVIGLVGHGLIKRCRYESNNSTPGNWARSPGDEDRTPPELRPGSNCSGGRSRRNSSRTRHIPGTLPGHGGTPFFNGKLILHDPPGLVNGARGAMRPFNPGNVLGASSTGFMMTSPPSKLGAVPKKMPSPAAQVTDILVSPKYDDGETTEEEDSDDTVYECPGLGTTKGMEVRNPFFMEGAEMHPTPRLANKKPISQYTDLFHHQEIVGLN